MVLIYECQTWVAIPELGRFTNNQLAEVCNGSMGCMQWSVIVVIQACMYVFYSHPWTCSRPRNWLQKGWDFSPKLLCCPTGCTMSTSDWHIMLVVMTACSVMQHLWWKLLTFVWRLHLQVLAGPTCSEQSTALSANMTKCRQRWCEGMLSPHRHQRLLSPVADCSNGARIWPLFATDGTALHASVHTPGHVCWRDRVCQTALVCRSVAWHQSHWTWVHCFQINWLTDNVSCYASLFHVNISHY